MNIKWLRLIWIYLYMYGVFATGIRLILNILAVPAFNEKLANYLSGFYRPIFSPLPYLILCILYFFMSYSTKIQKGNR